MDAPIPAPLTGASQGSRGIDLVTYAHGWTMRVEVLAFGIAILALNAYMVIVKGLPAYVASAIQLTINHDGALQRHSLLQIWRGDNGNGLLWGSQYVKDLPQLPASLPPVPTYIVSLYFDLIDAAIARVFPFGHNIFYLQATAIASFVIPSLVLAMTLGRSGILGASASLILSAWIWLSKGGAYLVSGYFFSGHTGALLAFLALVAFGYRRYTAAVLLSIGAVAGRTLFLGLPAGMILYLLLERRFRLSAIASALLVVLVAARELFVDRTASDFAVKSVGLAIDSLPHSLEFTLEILLVFLLLGGICVLLLGARNRTAIPFITALIFFAPFCAFVERKNDPHYQFQFELLTLGALAAVLIRYLHQGQTRNKYVDALIVPMLLASLVMRLPTGQFDTIRVVDPIAELNVALDRFATFRNDVMPEYRMIPTDASVFAMYGASLHLEGDYQVMNEFYPDELTGRSSRFQVVAFDVTTFGRLRSDISNPDERRRSFPNAPQIMADLVAQFPYAWEGKYLVLFSSRPVAGYNDTSRHFVYDSH